MPRFGPGQSGVAPKKKRAAPKRAAVPKPARAQAPSLRQRAGGRVRSYPGAAKTFKPPVQRARPPRPSEISAGLGPPARPRRAERAAWRHYLTQVAPIDWAQQRRFETHQRALKLYSQGKRAEALKLQREAGLTPSGIDLGKAFERAVMWHPVPSHVRETIERNPFGAATVGFLDPVYTAQTLWGLPSQFRHEARAYQKHPTLGGAVNVALESGAIVPGRGEMPRRPEGVREPHVIQAHIERVTKNPKSKTPKGRLTASAQRQVVALRKELRQATPPQEKVRQALAPARAATARQLKGYGVARAENVERAEQAYHESGGGLAGFAAAMREHRGELPKVKFQHLGDLTEQDLGTLIRYAWEHPELQHYQKVRIAKGLTKAASGQALQRNEIALFQHVYGQDAAKAVEGMSLAVKAGHIAYEIAGIPRSLMSSFDFSAPFRQGIVAGARHPVIFAKNFKPMFKAFGHRGSYRAILDDIRSRPTYGQMLEAGVKFTEVGGKMNKREEAFISELAEKIGVPVKIKGERYWVGPGEVVRMSGQAYTGFLDKMRADMFDHQLELARRAGVNIEDREQLHQIARLVNNATGRGDLGRIEQWGPFLNSVFFSPRLIASRVNMLNPFWYASLSPFARRQALRSMIQLGAAATGLLGVASYFGGRVGTDPRSADFGKLRIANTRFDILGGFPAYPRTAYQIARGQRIVSSTGELQKAGGSWSSRSLRKDIAERFLSSKLNPPASAVWDFFQGSDYAMQPFDVKKAALTRIIPLVAQDAKEMYGNYDSVPLALAGYAISMFGVGATTYGKGKAPSAKGLSDWQKKAKAVYKFRGEPIPPQALRFEKMHLGVLDAREKLRSANRLADEGTAERERQELKIRVHVIRESYPNDPAIQAQTDPAVLGPQIDALDPLRARTLVGQLDSRYLGGSWLEEHVSTPYNKLKLLGKLPK